MTRTRRGKARPGEVLNGFEVMEFLGHPKEHKNSIYRCRHLKCGNVVDVWGTKLYSKRGDETCSACPKMKDHRLLNRWQKVSSSGWPDFWQFANEVGEPTGDRQTLIALDKSKPIGPGNWKWATRCEAVDGKPVEVCGVSLKQIDWADIIGISRERVRQRVEHFGSDIAILRYPKAKRYISKRTGVTVSELTAKYEDLMAQRKPSGRPPLYDWSKWFDGDLHILEQHTDFDCSTVAFQTSALSAARKLKLKVVTRCIGSTVFLKVTKGIKR